MGDYIGPPRVNPGSKMCFCCHIKDLYELITLRIINAHVKLYEYGGMLELNLSRSGLQSTG